MANGAMSGRWPKILRYSSAVALFVVAAVATSAGAQWYVSLIAFCTVLVLFIGRRRIFRPGVKRSEEEERIVCRYIPWYEGNVYVLNVLLPLLGVASIGAGLSRGNPVWLGFAGTVLLILTPLFTYSAVRMWRRCFLAISPTALTVRLAAPKDDLTEIRCEAIQSIEPRVVPNGVSGQSLQVAIAYQTPDLTTKTVLLGLQLSVQPVNLLHALVAWKESAHDNPGELLDRIERVLRGQLTAGV